MNSGMKDPQGNPGSALSRRDAPVILILCSMLFIFTAAAGAQTSTSSLRSFEDIFPGLRADLKEKVFSEEGFLDSYWKNEGQYFVLFPAQNSGINVHNTVLKSNPGYLAESLVVVPYSIKVLDRLDAYNAIGKIRDLKGRVYHSYTKDEYVPLFEEATRIDSDKRNVAIPDPQPAKMLPNSETIYIRLKDVNFKNSYYRADISMSPHGIIFNLTNNKTITYMLFTVMREGNFNAVLYMEPIAEGMMIYSLASANASDFVASKVRIPSAIEKRLGVFVDWVKDGLNGLY